MRRMKTSSEYQRRGTMSWLKWVGVFVVAQAAWFLLLLPLIPSTLVGFVGELTAGLLVLALVYGAVRAIDWLLGSSIKNSLAAALSLAIALGVASAIFGAAYWCREFLTGNFSYMH